MFGLDKSFVKAMHHQDEGFKHVSELFPYKTEAKIKHDIFVRPEIRKVLKDKDFKTKLSSNELDAWNAFVLVVQNYLGMHNATNYTENVEQMLQSYKEMGARMSLKMHFLHSNLDFFLKIMEISAMSMGKDSTWTLNSLKKGRLPRNVSPAMMADFC